MRYRRVDNRREIFQTGLVVDKLWLTHNIILPRTGLFFSGGYLKSMEILKIQQTREHGKK
jgi:hypothetical protein